MSAAPHAVAKKGTLVVGALGVVYGDIGTSPLYALEEAFTEEAHALGVDRINVFGICSLAFWSLVIIISIKYLMFVMRADNNGEGGILALTSLVMKRREPGQVARAGVLVGLGIFGTALLYGDGIITPSISVLAAVGGLEKVSPGLGDWVVPIAIVILVGLFAVQRRGTGAVGRVFGPIMILWFAVLALLGLTQLVRQPEILESVNPIWVLRYFQHETKFAFLALGSIFLVVTGGEALYADMGHFGRHPIVRGWYFVVFPALVLNYWGQGALLLRDPEAIDGMFFNLAPKALLLPLVLLATMATIIASQALISGVFSLTAQAVQLDYLPRIRIDHTSKDHAGQIYVPLVNWLLAAACIGLVVGFQTSSNLAAAYGIAVTMTMAITTLIFFRVCTDRWRWSRAKAFAVCGPMFVVELGFLGANIPKIPHGGWLALAVAIILMVQMQTWRRGRQLVAARIQRGERPISEVLDQHTGVTRVAGTGVFLFKDRGKAPPALVNNLEHNKVLHRTTLIVAIETAEEPRVPAEQRAEVVRVEPGVFQVVLRHGFMEEPDVPAALAGLEVRGLEFDLDDVTYFIGRESIFSGKAPGMHPAFEHLFVWLNRGADSAVRFFNLPPERVFEVGSRVEI
ncbi:MAG: potassium transporter Kup [Actinobacteria bacterium]|nr:potassium transporter Kup [Actinomycetota bacterium]